MRLPIPTLMVMAATTSTVSVEATQANTTIISQRVRQTATSHMHQHADNTTARNAGVTDGTFDSMDFASRIRGATRRSHRNAALAQNHIDSVALSDISENLSSPKPAFYQGHDGHHSHHEVIPDRGYHSGPSIESGSS